MAEIHNYRLMDKLYLTDAIKARRHIEAVESLYKVDLTNYVTQSDSPLATGITTLATSKIPLTGVSLRLQEHSKSLPWVYRNLLDGLLVEIAPIRETLTVDEYTALTSVGTVSKIDLPEIIQVLIYSNLMEKGILEHGEHDGEVERYMPAINASVLVENFEKLETHEGVVNFLQRLPWIVNEWLESKFR